MKIISSVVLSILLLFPVHLTGEVKLSSIFGDNMVLQQNSNVQFFGTSSAGKKITCTSSWSNKKSTTQANKMGKWTMSIPTPVAGGPYNISFDDGTKLVLSNILIGEVWFCSGQSNMEMPVKGFRGQPVFDSQKYIATANTKRQLRLFTVKNAWSTTLKDDGIEGCWAEASSNVIADFSATGFFFGDMLQRALDVPVGLIQCDWSASNIEAWMSQETLSSFKDVKLPDVSKKEFGWVAGTPTLLYNAMVNPWKGFPIKGVIWYQGEANSPNPELYRKLFPAMVNEWRTFFNNKDLPFYYVQIAPWQSAGCDKTDWADFRQVQLELMNSLPNLGMVTTGDAGSIKFIHPPYKIKVGERLAYWALANAYNHKGIQYSGPIYKDCKVKENGIVEVEFCYGDNGLIPENESIIGFEIAGADGKFVDANAEILNGTPKVKVWNDNVKKPVEVRYCYRNFKAGTLCNNAQIPASPFKAIIKQ
ncbi:MAG: sialate O-acetylesterase [Muribaculaceae bacterium]